MYQGLRTNLPRQIMGFRWVFMIGLSCLCSELKVVMTMMMMVMKTMGFRWALKSRLVHVFSDCGGGGGGGGGNDLTS
eukprot:644597-Pelagomonas_calceolata.AAC.1